MFKELLREWLETDKAKLLVKSSGVDTIVLWDFVQWLDSRGLTLREPVAPIREAVSTDTVASYPNVTVEIKRHQG